MRRCGECTNCNRADCGVCIFCLDKKYGDQVERKNVVKRGNVSQSTSQSLLLNQKMRGEQSIVVVDIRDYSLLFSS